ncbi:MAG: DNA polymerase III subunit epsilon [Inquilinaceae bacterium]
MREIVLDTETTGRDADKGDRIVEIGCLALVNHMPTTETFQRYINPEAPMDPGAEAVHGLSEAFLADKPTFAEIVGDFLAFIGDSPLVIHNAAFDLAFLNAEFARLGLPKLPPSRAVDTLALARRKFPGAQASLDALCRRFEIDNSNRALHGALLDSQLLAEVYLELRGGRQPGLVLAGPSGGAGRVDRVARERRTPRPHAPTEAEIAAHRVFLDQIKTPIWSS